MRLMFVIFLFLSAIFSGCLIPTVEDTPVAVTLNSIEAKPICTEDTKNLTCRFDPVVPINAFELMDTDGVPVNITDYQGKVVVITFLFTRCPDVCPVVAANLNLISILLGERYPEEVSILSVTVDPFTDNASVLGQYAEDRGLTWPFLTGDVDQIEPVWQDFGVGVENYNSDNDSDGVVDGFDICPNTPQNETVDSDGCGIDTQNGNPNTTGRSISGRHHPLDYWVVHTTGTILIDKQLNQRAWWGDTAWVPEMVVTDLEVLLDEVV